MNSKDMNIRDLDKLNQETLKAIINFSYSGFLIINNDMIITTINQWACDFFGMEMEDILYKDTTDIFPNSELVKVLTTGEVHKNKITVRNNKKIIISRMPIYNNDEIIGAIAIFQNYSSVQENEIDIKSYLNEKGLIAKYKFDDIIYKSKIIDETISIAKTFSTTDSTILITGESGCGKELFAQSIHNHSHRKNKPFVALNCATLSESILESELFGYSDASFTGAKKGGKTGLFQLADGGTLFLDEIGEIPLSFQTKFLRTLQEKQIRPVGSDTIIPIDVRIIAATNKNLYEEVEKKNFRLDLFYRINVLTLSVPPLRERHEDIFDIAFEYFDKSNPVVYLNHKSTIHNILTTLSNYKFPGNVRELENILERLVLLLSQGLLKNNMADILNQLIDNYSIRDLNIDETNIKSVLETAEKKEIVDLLLKMNGDKKKVAKLLGISHSTLWRRMKTYHIK